MVDQGSPLNQIRRQSHLVATIAALVVGHVAVVAALVIDFVVAPVVGSVAGLVFVVIVVVPLPRSKKSGCQGH